MKNSSHVTKTIERLFYKFKKKCFKFIYFSKKNYLHLKNSFYFFYTKFLYIFFLKKKFFCFNETVSLYLILSVHIFFLFKMFE